MRCAICGWSVGPGRCPCGSSEEKEMAAMVPIGARVLARAGRGPSMLRWDKGGVQAHLGTVHRVETAFGVYWCEADDLLAVSPGREALLVKGARVWALWLDGRWYPGAVDGLEGPLRLIRWDDGDAMWLEAGQAVVMAVHEAPPEAGREAVAERWDGDRQRVTIREEEEGGFRVVFPDGEEALVSREELKTFPPNPFLSPAS